MDKNLLNKKLLAPSLHFYFLIHHLLQHKYELLFSAIKAKALGIVDTMQRIAPAWDFVSICALFVPGRRRRNGDGNAKRAKKKDM